MKWNARINLTAIRTPEEIVRRHFGESLFAGLRLGDCQTLLDFGSGAGFPGLPIQLLRPDVAVTVAESRSRKAAFLHEVVRSLELRAEVWAGRVEAMPASRRFDVVTLRAVDNMEAALGEAGRRAGQRILILGTRNMGSGRTSLPPELAEQFPVREQTAAAADGGWGAFRAASVMAAARGGTSERWMFHVEHSRVAEWRRAESVLHVEHLSPRTARPLAQCLM